MLIQSLDTLMTSKSNEKLDFSLKGLLKSHIGMLIAAPNVGKSHLALCLAMEHASSMTLVGMTACSEPKKTLVLSSEDGAAVIQERMQKKLESCSLGLKNELNDHLHFMTDMEPIVVPPDSSVAELSENRDYLNRLVDVFSQFDLVIVDTVTEAIGRCEEVRHDRLIKNTFQELAQKSGASLLLVHHVNKDEIRGNQEITMASGAGLTSIMRLTKCLFTLKSNKDGLSIKYLKSNYLPALESKEFTVEIRQELTINPVLFSLKLNNKRDSRVVKKVGSTPSAIKLSGTLPQEEEIKNKKTLRNIL